MSRTFSYVSARPFHFFFTPATWVFIKLSKRVARFTGRGLSQSGAFVTVEYLEKLVEIGGQEGSISEDDAGLIRSMKTEQINHDPAHTLFNTGSANPGRPAIGWNCWSVRRAWTRRSGAATSPVTARTVRSRQP